MSLLCHVILDDQMTLAPEISAVVSNFFFALRQLKPVVRLFGAKERALLVGSAVNARLDYCNALLNSSHSDLGPESCSGILYSVQDNLCAYRCVHQNAPRFVVETIQRYIPP